MRTYDGGVRLILTLFIFLPLLLTAEEEQFTTLEEAINGLKNEQYAMREAASAYLWQNASLEKLENYRDDPDPEVRYRVRELLSLMCSGVSPDTPADIRALTEAFHTAGLQLKRQIIGSLQQKEAYFQIFSLYSCEKDEKTKKLLFPLMNSMVTRACFHYISDGKPEIAKKIIDMAGDGQATSRLWAAISVIEGDSEERLRNFQQDADLTANEKEQYLALLRATGQVPEAKELAEEMDKKSYLAAQSLLNGDVRTYFQWWKEHFIKSKVENDFLKAYELRLSDSWEDLEDFTEVFTEAGLKGRVARRKSRLYLHTMGKLEAAYDLLSNKEKKGMLEYLTTRDRYRDLFKLYDVEFGKPLTDEWIESNIGNKEGEWWFSSSRTQINELGYAFMALGDIDSVRRMLAPLWEEAKKDEETSFDFINILSTETFPSYRSLAIDFMQDLEERDDKRYKAIFIEGSPSQAYLWDLSENVFPEISYAERIALIDALTRGNIDGQKIMEMTSTLLEEVKKDCAENPEDTIKEEYLGNFYFILGDQENYLKYIRARVQQDPSSVNKNLLINRLLFLSEWEEAAEIIDSLELKGQEGQDIYTLDWSAIYFLAGREEDGERLLTSYLSEKLNNPGSIYLAMERFMQQGAYDQALVLLEKGLMVTDPDEQKGIQWARFLEKGVKLYYKVGNYQAAAACGEGWILHQFKELLSNRVPLYGATGDEQLRALINMRMKTDVIWAMHYTYKEKDRDRALNYINLISEEWKGHGVLADDFYPFLRKAGYKRELEKSHDESIAQLKDNLLHYPGTAQLKNTLAWLSSRAVMNLEEAEKLSKEAVESSPRTAAYLDTYAEVSFALGDREKAVHYSKRAWQDAITITMGDEGMQVIKEQYFYFLKAPLPQKE